MHFLNFLTCTRNILASNPGQYNSCPNISTFLEERFQIEPSSAKNIAKISKGNLNRAITIHLDAGISETNRSLFVNWMRLCYSRNIADTIDWVNEFSKIGREQIKDFIIYSLEMYRQCIMGNYNMEIEGVHKSERSVLEKFSDNRFESTVTYAFL